ncbi:MAG: putative nitroreductase [Nocardioides sp.]|nr:putative nitroreductase [Nocardioides sp.]
MSAPVNTDAMSNPGDRVHAPMPGAEALAEPMRSRWSPSIFDDRHVLGRDELIRILRAGQWSPSSGNLQPWAFVMAERGGPSHVALVEHLSRGNAGWVPRAAVVIITAARVAADPADPDGSRVKAAALSYYDLGQAAAHMTLQARSMGLHAHQFGGFDKDAVARDLGVPEHYRVVSGIAIGRRGTAVEVDDRDREREQRERHRRPLQDFVHGAAWGSPWGEEAR